MDVSSLVNAEHLQSFRVKNAPPTVYYVPNFIGEEEEESLLHEFRTAPKPKWENYGGIVGKKGLVAIDDFPPLLRNLMCKVDKFLYVKTNHALVNEYAPGQGIMAHTDGPAFLPVITTVTLGSHGVLDLFRPVDPREASSEDSRRAGGLLLEPRSLVVITHNVYHDLLHGIAERRSDVIDGSIWNGEGRRGEEMERGTRISVTMRSVEKVSTRAIDKLLGIRK